VLASIESDWRRKYREDAEHGDTVWLNTEQDLLNSFMRRFRDNIYLVWDYPASALQRMQQGTCLLKVTINRHGDVDDVQLLESSGHLSLDREAIESVRKGATYGPLPGAYPHDSLKIMAFFQYSIGDVVQYRRRAGRIY
jgi:protein TonB